MDGDGVALRGEECEAYGSAWAVKVGGWEEVCVTGIVMVVRGETTSF